MSRVLERLELGPDLFELVVDREGMVYNAGDCTLLIHRDGVVARPYSFSSHPDQVELRFLFRRMKTGFSSWLASLNPGDEVGVGAPFGLFHPQGDHEVWLATGTGIAPFLSLLRADKPRTPHLFWYGVRQRSEAVFVDLLLRLTPLTIWYSRTDSVFPHERNGRFSANLSELPAKDDLEYYLCGQASMIRETSRWLTDAGVPRLHLHGEAFY